LAALATRSPRLFLTVALCAAAAAAALGAAGLGQLSPFSADDPGSESVRARELLGEARGVDPDFGLIVLVPAPEGLDAAATEGRVARVTRALKAEALVADVRTYYGTRDPTLVTADRHATYVAAGLRPAPIARQLDAARSVDRALEPIPGVKLGGRAAFYAHGNDTAREDLVRAELLAFPLLLLLTLWVFRGLVAALLPVLVGAVTVAGALGGVLAAGAVTEVSIYALNIVTALGLGLAIDYSLLILSRYREEALRVGYGREALRRALARTGPTVLFSSLTVAGAAAALLVFPQPFLRSIALGAIFVALLAGATALSVLPAALAALGHRVDALAPRRWRHAASRAARPATAGFWYRLARLVMRAPGRVAAASAIVLLALAAPSTEIATTAVDPNVVPKSSSDRQVAESFARERRSEPILLAAEPPAGTPASELRALAQRVGRLPGTASVSEPRRCAAHEADATCGASTPYPPTRRSPNEARRSSAPSVPSTCRIRCSWAARPRGSWT